jgi:hypothetical protein
VKQTEAACKELGVTVVAYAPLGQVEQSLPARSCLRLITYHCDDRDHEMTFPRQYAHFDCTNIYLNIMSFLVLSCRDRP